MQNFSRYLLVAFLITGNGITGNTVLANHWYHCMGCAPVYQPVYVEVCPPVHCCLPVECCHDSSVSSESHPVAPADASEYHDPGPTRSGSSTREMIPPPKAAPIPQPAVEPPAVDRPESSVVNKPAPMSGETEAGPPPIPVPQPSLDEIEATPASEPAAEPESDSLLDAPPTPAPVPTPDESAPADIPAADLFDEPAASEQPPVEADPLDDLMPPADEETEAPADPAEKEDPSLDDLFGQHQIQPVLSEPGGLASEIFRRWTDDGARFHCDARLQQVTAKTVVLLKNNGKRIAVYFSRLSDDDLQFVRRQVVAHRELLAQGEQLASLWSK